MKEKVLSRRSRHAKKKTVRKDARGMVRLFRRGMGGGQREKTRTANQLAGVIIDEFAALKPDRARLRKIIHDIFERSG
jgi:hypothetical protein